MRTIQFTCMDEKTLISGDNVAVSAIEEIFERLGTLGEPDKVRQALAELPAE